MRIPKDAVAVGTSEPMSPGSVRATCAACGGPAYFRDVTPLAVPLKWCVRCFLARVDTDTFPILLTPENIAQLRGLLAKGSGRPQ